MIELDYAYLADYAVVEGGRLTAVGASFTHIAVPAVPSQNVMAVAGRVKVSEDLEEFELTVTIVGPNDSWQLEFETQLPATDSVPYGGKRGVLFAVQASLPLPSTGLYSVHLALEGERVRTLKFEVSTQPS